MDCTPIGSILIDEFRERPGRQKWLFSDPKKYEFGNPLVCDHGRTIVYDNNGPPLWNWIASVKKWADASDLAYYLNIIRPIADSSR
jgi:hypothetical protein